MKSPLRNEYEIEFNIPLSSFQQDPYWEIHITVNVNFALSSINKDQLTEMLLYDGR